MNAQSETLNSVQKENTKPNTKKTKASILTSNSVKSTNIYLLVILLFFIKSNTICTNPNTALSLNKENYYLFA